MRFPKYIQIPYSYHIKRSITLVCRDSWRSKISQVVHVASCQRSSRIKGTTTDYVHIHSEDDTRYSIPLPPRVIPRGLQGYIPHLHENIGRKNDRMHTLIET